MTRALFLAAPCALGGSDAADAPAFRQLLLAQAEQQHGAHLRQASHFVRLAVLGALASAREAQLPPAGGVYLGTALGDLQSAAALFRQAAAGSGRPSPFDFVNVNNNTAAYYIARIAGLVGPNLTVTQGLFSFEWALRLALAQVRADGIPLLVGGVDEIGLTPVDQARRFQYPAGFRAGEGSGWVVVTAARERACAQVLHLSWGARVGAEDWLTHVHRECARVAPAGALTLWPGLGMTTEVLQQLRRRMPMLQVAPYLASSGAYPTVAAWSIARAVCGCPVAGVHAHMSANAAGDTVLLLWERLESAAGRRTP